MMTKESFLDVLHIDADVEDYLPTQGRVFQTFGGYDSGCTGYGLEANGHRWFIKHAWHPRAEAGLLRAWSIHKTVQHPALAPLRNKFEAPGGPALVYDWAHGQWLRDPKAAESFRQLPPAQAIAAIDTIFDLHAALAEKGFVAVDFYDGSLIYDFDAARMRVCDLDEYRDGPFTLDMERLPGSTRFMASEEWTGGSKMDEVTNVFVLGRMAAILLGDHAGRRKHWRCSGMLWKVVERATNPNRAERFGSVSEFVEAWHNVSDQV